MKFLAAKHIEAIRIDQNVYFGHFELGKNTARCGVGVLGRGAAEAQVQQQIGTHSNALHSFINFSVYTPEAVSRRNRYIPPARVERSKGPAPPLYCLKTLPL